MADFAGSPLRPRWVYDDGTAVDYLMSVPQKPWDFGSLGLGGSDTSAAGVPAAYEIRRDYLLHLTLRFPVSEWDDVARLVRHLQRAGSATYYPDQDNSSVAHTVYGHKPALGEEIRPRRSDYPSVLELDISVRRTTVAIFEDAYFGDLLFHWQAGETGPGSIFTRSSTGYYVNRSGVVSVAAANVERTEWTGPGFGTPALLLEDADTNLCLQSEDFATTWAAIGTPTISGGAHTASGISLDLIGDDDAAAAEGYAQVVSFAGTGDGVKSISLVMKEGATPPGSGSEIFLVDATAPADRLQATVTWSGGVPSVAMTTGTEERSPELLADGAYRLFFQTASLIAANANQLEVYPGRKSTVADTGDVYVGGVQAENSLHATSYIKTTVSTVTRTAEAQSFSYVEAPQELTAYLKFIERGTAIASVNDWLFQIGADANTYVRVLSSAGGPSGIYLANHHNGVSSVQSTLAATPAIGDTVEIRVTLSATGVLQLHQSINGALETSGAATAALPLAAAWSNSLLVINSNAAGAGAGHNAFMACKVARGTKTMAQMRVMSA